ncbi:MAG: hypothetical protein MAG795_00650 [Candidatus Woesearchaeota archaeon]|nr:hypothetical protein [Candidatus Woesearchaeota archaeon]
MPEQLRNGAKRSEINSSQQIFFTLGIIVYSLGQNFSQFLIAELLWAAGRAFISGADSAMVYDTLIDLKKKQDYKKIWGNIHFIHLFSLAVASIVGGIIGQHDFRYTLYAMIPFFIFLTPIALSLKEPKKHKTLHKKGELLKSFNVIKKTLSKDNKLILMIIYSAIIFGLNNAAWLLYQPYFALIGIPVIFFGVIWASLQVFSGFSSKLSHFVESKIGLKKSTIIVMLFVGMGYLFMGNIFLPFGFIFIYFHQFVRGFSTVIFSDYVNKRTKSNLRATILSVQNLLGRVVYALVIPIIGWISDVYTLSSALIVLGATTIITGTIMLLILHYNEVI